MPSIIDCPSCRRNLRVPDDLVGRLVKCPTCGTTFTATAGLSEAAFGMPEPEEAPLPRAADPAVPPELPRQPAASPGSRRPRLAADDQDLRRQPGASEYRAPHRGTLILVLGILSIALSGCLGFILGPIAWIMGSNDLQEIRAGRMDREGEGLTKAGRICGIVGTVIHVFMLCCGGLVALFSILAHKH